MKITILASNLSENSTGRALLLAQALELQYEVEIVGPMFGEKLWLPALTSHIPIFSVQSQLMPNFLSTAYKIITHISGDIVIACKPLLPSFGIALINKFIRGQPVFLDIDDDEIAMTAPGYNFSLYKKMRDPLGSLYTNWINKFINQAEGFFCISDRYRQLYGGVLVPHGKDTFVVDPALYSKKDIRTRLGFKEHDELIGFVGTPRPHKGIDLILTAIKKASRPNLKLLLVGASSNDEYIASLHKQFGELLLIFPAQPMEKMPYFLSAIDLIVILQRNTPAAQGQVPAKLFDAMAMGKPIIASAVGDIPAYLGDAGILISPDDIEALTNSINTLLDNRQEANLLGNKARQRCVEKFSLENMRNALNQEIERVLINHRK